MKIKRYLQIIYFLMSTYCCIVVNSRPLHQRGILYGPAFLNILNPNRKSKEAPNKFQPENYVSLFIFTDATSIRPGARVGVPEKYSDISVDDLLEYGDYEYLDHLLEFLDTSGEADEKVNARSSSINRTHKDIAPLFTNDIHTSQYWDPYFLNVDIEKLRPHKEEDNSMENKTPRFTEKFKPKDIVKYKKPEAIVNVESETSISIDVPKINGHSGTITNITNGDFGWVAHSSVSFEVRVESPVSKRDRSTARDQSHSLGSDLTLKGTQNIIDKLLNSTNTVLVTTPRGTTSIANSTEVPLSTIYLGKDNKLNANYNNTSTTFSQSKITTSTASTSINRLTVSSFQTPTTTNFPITTKPSLTFSLPTTMVSSRAKHVLSARNNTMLVPENMDVRKSKHPPRLIVRKSTSREILLKSKDRPTTVTKAIAASKNNNSSMESAFQNQKTRREEEGRSRKNITVESSLMSLASQFGTNPQGINPTGSFPFGSNPSGSSPFGRVPQGSDPLGPFNRGLQDADQLGNISYILLTPKEDVNGEMRKRKINPLIGFEHNDGKEERYHIQIMKPDGSINGDYVVLDHETGSVSGVRYEAVDGADQDLVQRTLLNFLSLDPKLNPATKRS